MNYIELRNATRGKEFIRNSNGKKLTRTEFYFATDPEERIMAVNGFEGKWTLQDKPEWRDGSFIERNEPVTFKRETLYGAN